MELVELVVDMAAAAVLVVQQEIQQKIMVAIVQVDYMVVVVVL